MHLISANMGYNLEQEIVHLTKIVETNLLRKMT